MEFHPTQVTGSGSGGEAEENVWDSLKQALGPDDNGVTYYRYPVVDKAGDRFDREPDILLLHEDVGLMVIEVKGYTIGQIEKIEGNTWYLTGTSQDYSTPYTQARDQAFFIKSWFDREEELRTIDGQSKVPVNFTVALPNISRDEWEKSGLDVTPSTPRAITADELSPQKFREHILSEPGDTSDFGPEEMEVAIAVLSGSTVISGSRSPPAPEPTTKSEYYEKVIKGLKRFDDNQETIGSEIPPGPQRIRGIAGSGKTVLIAKKAAHLHTKFPEDDIVVTYYTKSLNDEISTLIEHFHYLMTDEPPNWDKLRVMHGWGGKTSGDGVYYNLSQETDVGFRDARSAKELFAYGADPLQKLEKCCAELVNEGDIPEMYDAILIDEGQDFGKWFYRMCRNALRPLDSGNKRLIWAYDEAQTLGDLEIPTSKEIFGTDDDGDPVVDLSGSYKNGIQRSRIMRRSYRSPREILMLAHAFGMGVQRKSGYVNAFTNQERWEKIGYEVDGDFVSEEDTILTRPDEYSPHPLQHESGAKPFTKFSGFSNKNKECEYVAEEVRKDVEDRGLDPEDILVIPLGTPGNSEESGRDIASEIRSTGLSVNSTWTGDADVFRKRGEVTLSRINRAKGNEAAMVYLVNIEKVEGEERFEPLFACRNQAFVGITRSRGWCTITGIEGDNVSEEARSLIDEINSDDQFTFPGENIVDEGEETKMDRTLDEF